MNPPRIYCYHEYDPRRTLPENHKQIQTWVDSWLVPEWEPCLLSSYTMVEHRLLKAMMERLAQTSATADTCQRYYRWLAIDAMLKRTGTPAYFSHSDLLNGGFKHHALGMEKSLVSFDNESDCLVYGEPRMYRDFVGVLLDALAYDPVPRPWAVLLAWRGVYIHTVPGLITRSGKSLLTHQQVNHP